MISFREIRARARMNRYLTPEQRAFRWRRMWLPCIVWGVVGLAAVIFYVVGGYGRPEFDQRVVTDIETSRQFSEWRRASEAKNFASVLSIYLFALFLYGLVKYRMVALRGAHPVIKRAKFLDPVIVLVVTFAVVMLSLTFWPELDTDRKSRGIAMVCAYPLGIGLGMATVWFRRGLSRDRSRLEGMAFAILKGASHRDYAPEMSRFEVGTALALPGGVRFLTWFAMVFPPIWVAQWVVLYPDIQKEIRVLVVVVCALVYLGAIFKARRALKLWVSIERPPTIVTGDPHLRRHASRLLCYGATS